MLSLTRSLGGLSLGPVAAASRAGMLASSPLGGAAPSALSVIAACAPTAAPAQRRFVGEIVNPRKVRFRKAHKGRIPLPLGGSKAGTQLIRGDYGIRLREGARISAKQLEAARRVIRRKIRVAKGSEMWLRVFPDVPVTSKGNETRMGKGKGTLDHYMCRVPMGRIVFEIGGPGLRWEVAKDALRQAGLKLPAAFEIVQASKEKAKAEAAAAAAAAKVSPPAQQRAPRAEA